MLNKSLCVDYIIIGAGIIGLGVARELANQYPQAKIAVLEKESKIGLHASGRNSGVLHSGIYYKEGSLKAKFCLDGSRAMAAYCDEYSLPINRIGKVIVSQKNSDGPLLDMLYRRALANGANVSLINESELKKIEPSARSVTNFALFSPETSVVDPKSILLHLYQDLLKKNVAFFFNTHCVDVDTKQKKLSVGHEMLSYGHLFNTAGLHADRVARACGLVDRYTMIPFKGMYYELASTSVIQINHLIYPVPDMNVPFLGVHFTKGIDGKVYIGPTAIPALGREHYSGVQGIQIKEALNILFNTASCYITNNQGFRSYAHQELPRCRTTRFVAAASSLVPGLQQSDVLKSSKVGIRAQLLDKHKRELVMDFLVRKTENATHILNAVSPAFTSAFSFAKFIVDSFGGNAIEKELA